MKNELNVGVVCVQLGCMCECIQQLKCDICCCSSVCVCMRASVCVEGREAALILVLDVVYMHLCMYT